jgi:hypothetical protein
MLFIQILKPQTLCHKANYHWLIFSSQWFHWLATHLSTSYRYFSKLAWKKCATHVTYRVQVWSPLWCSPAWEVHVEK